MKKKCHEWGEHTGRDAAVKNHDHAPRLTLFHFGPVHRRSAWHRLLNDNVLSLPRNSRAHPAAISRGGEISSSFFSSRRLRKAGQNLRAMPKSAPKNPKKPSAPSAQFWLVKQEPEAYSFETFLRDKKTSWDGVRNYQARIHLRAMRRGDPVLFYESVTTKAIVGLAEVSKENYPDPTAEEPGWVSVELKAIGRLPRPVSLDTIKKTPALKDIGLLRQGRLSTMPVTVAEYAAIQKLAAESI
jgi:predicted RNA-binding protein with PUA-like domain